MMDVYFTHSLNRLTVMQAVDHPIQNNTGKGQGCGGLVQRWRGVADGL